jgi:hypothetical protein
MKILSKCSTNAFNALIVIIASLSIAAISTLQGAAPALAVPNQYGEEYVHGLRAADSVFDMNGSLDFPGVGEGFCVEMGVGVGTSNDIFAQIDTNTLTRTLLRFYYDGKLDHLFTLADAGDASPISDNPGRDIAASALAYYIHQNHDMRTDERVLGLYLDSSWRGRSEANISKIINYVNGFIEYHGGDEIFRTGANEVSLKMNSEPDDTLVSMFTSTGGAGRKTYIDGSWYISFPAAGSNSRLEGNISLKYNSTSYVILARGNGQASIAIQNSIEQTAFSRNYNISSPTISISTDIQGPKIKRDNGNIVDRVSWSADSDMVCNSTAPPARCGNGNYTQGTITAQLYKMNSTLTGVQGAPVLTATCENSGLFPKGEDEGLAHSGTIDCTYNNPGDGIFVSIVTYNYLGSSASTSNTDPREMFSTYSKPIEITTLVSNAEYLDGHNVKDTIWISGRENIPDIPNFNCLSTCASTQYNYQFYRNKSLNWYVMGPLASAPNTTTPDGGWVYDSNTRNNNPDQEYTFKCIDGSLWCPAAQGTLPIDAIIDAGSTGYEFDPDIPQENMRPGWYVFVYKYDGDTFTNATYSNAGDASERFVMYDNSGANPKRSVEMWSKATTHAETNSQIRDVVYVTGDVRLGSYLTIRAYRASDPKIPALGQCTQDRLLYESQPISVGPIGGQYFSNWVNSNQVGNVYWVATLHDQDGTVYRDMRDSGFIDWQGICGEAEETTHVFWEANLTSDATKTVYEGSQIKDTAYLSNYNSFVPSGATIEFRAYKDDEVAIGESAGNLVYSNTRALTDIHSGIDSDLLNLPVGRYYWVVVVRDIWGEEVAHGIFGDRSEISDVVKVTSQVSNRYMQIGNAISDKYMTSQNMPDDLVLVPLLKDSSGNIVADYQAIPLSRYKKEYSTPNYYTDKIGTYYFSFLLYSQLPSQTDVNSDKSLHDGTLGGGSQYLLKVGNAFENTETFDVNDTSSKATPEVFAGEGFSDMVTISGNYPANACVLWEIYLQQELKDINSDYGNPNENDTSSTKYDKLVKTTSCKPFNSSLNNTIYSDEYSFTVPGTYYWIEKIYPSKELSQTASEPIAKGNPRLINETTVIKPLKGTIKTHTNKKVFIGQPFKDYADVTLDYAPKGDEVIIWQLYKQSDRDDTRYDKIIPLDDFTSDKTFEPTALDSCKQTSSPLKALDAKYTFYCESPEYSTTLTGTYYWVASVVSGDKKEPIALHQKREESETVQVVPLTDTVDTWSNATNFVRVNEDFSDEVHIIGMVPKNGWIKWKVYRQGDASNSNSDELVYETKPKYLTPDNMKSIEEDGDIYTKGEAVVHSDRLNFTRTGKYYWVEEVYSPLQTDPVSVGEKRVVSEQTIVEAKANKMVRIGNASGALKKGSILGKTGVSIAFVSIVAILTGTGAIWLRKLKKSKRKDNDV